MFQSTQCVFHAAPDHINNFMKLLPSIDKTKTRNSEMYTFTR